jgi:protein-L-isoaspartate(D-aspartate) O-methyltransferase
MDFAAARRTMVDSQIKTGAITDPVVVDAMGAVPRENFLPEARRAVAYVDENIAVGKGRFVMDPLILAKLLQIAEIQPTDKALVVGANGGYSAAVLARMASRVVALDSDRDLTVSASSAFAMSGIANIQVVTGDLAAGHAAGAPYDVIVIGGAVAEIPGSLKLQLADGGRLVAIVRDGPMGHGVVIERVGATFGVREVFDAVIPVLPGFEKLPKFVF